MIEDAKTLGDLLDKAAEKWPDREAIVFGKERIHYHEYRDKVDQLAKALLNIGIRKGDKVSILFSNRPEWSISEYAVDKIGAIVVPINTRYKTHELEYILQSLRFNHAHHDGPIPGDRLHGHAPGDLSGTFEM